MGVAYYIELDVENPGFETFVNGKAVARASEAVGSITKALGLPAAFDLMSFGDHDDEFDVPEEHREKVTPWFPAADGLAWASAVRRHIEANPASVEQPARVVADLREYEAVFEKAAELGARWHFLMDF